MPLLDSISKVMNPIQNIKDSSGVSFSNNTTIVPPVMDKVRQERIRLNNIDTENSLALGKLQRQVDTSRTPIKDKSFFTISDPEGGKLGRGGTKVNKTVLSDLAIAAAQEGVPLIEALTTAMRETGIGGSTYKYGGGVTTGGVDERVYSPNMIMNAHSATSLTGIPQSFEKYRLSKGLVDKKFVETDKSGVHIKFDEPQDEKDKHLEQYSNYLKVFKPDLSLAKPFVAEMRVMKNQPGQKYNSREPNRQKYLDRDMEVILKNNEMYMYAKSVYDKNLPKKKGSSILEKVTKIK